MTAIAIFNGKGGVGKTTLTTIVGVELDANWIDADPQGSLSLWGARRDAMVHEASGSSVSTLLPSLQGTTLIDTPGALVSDINPILQAADLIILPTSLRQADLDTLGAAAGVAVTSGTPAAVVLTRVHPRTRVENVAHLFEGLGLPLCPFRLAERVIYDHAFCAGKSAVELEPVGPAAEESRYVANWIANHAHP